MLPACCIQKLPASRQRLQQTNIMLFKWLDAFNLQLTPTVKAIEIFTSLQGTFLRWSVKKYLFYFNGL
jgi:hypothetical protein